MVLPFDGSLTRLQWFVQGHLPAVYDDSLSYYELLAKVVAQLNTNTDFANSVNSALTDLINDYNGLKDQPVTQIGQLAKFADYDSKFSVLGQLVTGLPTDGVTDATSVLKTALEAGTGKRLYIPNGTYIISGSIQLPSNIHLIFGANCTIKAKNAMNVPFFKNDYTNGNTNIKIEGGIFDGNGANQTGNTCIFQFKNVTGLTINDVTLKNTYGLATNFANITGFRFENIKCDQDGLSPNQDGIHVCGPAKNGVIRNVTGLHGTTWLPSMLTME
jgi:polygalacturonase